MRWWLGLIGACGSLAAAPAWAQDLRDYCPERPGLDTPACIVDKGHASVEAGFVDWTHEHDGASRTDTFLIGDTVARLGLTDGIEARVGWTPLGLVREKDRVSGDVRRTSRTGDVYLGVKASLLSPSGDGLSIALLPQATLPAGRRPIGAGDWGAGLLIPGSYELSDAVQLELTPEVDAAVDEDGNGRHLAYGTAAGVGFKLSKAVTITLEGEALRDRDPSGHATTALASFSLGWLPRDDVQFDFGAIAGLNKASPDVELEVGISKRF